MDGETFDALARGAGIQAVRRAALAGLVGGPLGLDWRATGIQDRGAAMGACKIWRCKTQVLGMPCTDRCDRPDDHACWGARSATTSGVPESSRMAAEPPATGTNNSGEASSAAGFLAVRSEKGER